MSRLVRAGLGAMACVVVATVTTAQVPSMFPPSSGMPEINPVLSFYASGSYGGGSTASTVMSTDDWHETLMIVGDTSDRNICMGGTTGLRPGAAVLPAGQRPMITWRIAAKREAFDGVSAAFTIRWRREIHGPDIEPTADAGGEFTWRGSDGSRRMLDFVRQVPAAVPGCETMGIEMSTTIVGASELNEALIGYDVWVVQRLPSGARRTQRFQTSGQQGAGVSFAFPIVTLDMPAASGKPASSIDVRVTGRITGRLRRDGTIDLAVDAGRFVGQSGGRGIHQGNSGGTRLTVSPNETVEFQPPPVFGANDGAYAAVLAEAPTAIRVRARRLW